MEIIVYLAVLGNLLQVVTRATSICKGEGVNKVVTRNDIDFLNDKFTKRFTGKLRFIGDYPPGITSCYLDPLSPIQKLRGWIPAAVSAKDYRQSLMCGVCLKISPRSGQKRSFLLPKNSLTTTYHVTVVDVCPHCKIGEIRMYKDADLNHGSYDMIYEAVDCPDIDGDDGNIRVKMDKCNDKETRFQVKNSKIPTSKLEIYANDMWKCLKRTEDNFFTLQKNETKKSTPLKMRSTAITGQTIGFSLPEGSLFRAEYSIPGQYFAFAEVAITGVPKPTCDIPPSKAHNTSLTEQDNSLTLNKHITSSFSDHENSAADGKLESEGTTAHLTMNANFESQLLKSLKQQNTTNAENEKPIDTTSDTQLTLPELTRALSQIGNATEETWLDSIPLSSKLDLPSCSAKMDGRYEIAGDCKSYLVCENGVPKRNECSGHLLFNSDTSECDSPTKSPCVRQGIENRMDISSSYLQQTMDDQIYTKRFT